MEATTVKRFAAEGRLVPTTFETCTVQEYVDPALSLPTINGDFFPEA
jgi:hypothetical protein